MIPHSLRKTPGGGGGVRTHFHGKSLDIPKKLEGGDGDRSQGCTGPRGRTLGEDQARSVSQAGVTPESRACEFSMMAETPAKDGPVWSACSGRTVRPRPWRTSRPRTQKMMSSAMLVAWSAM